MRKNKLNAFFSSWILQIGFGSMVRCFDGKANIPHRYHLHCHCSTSLHISVYLSACLYIHLFPLSLSLSIAFFSKSQSTFLAFFHYFRPIYLFTWIHIVQCGQKVLRSDREWKAHSTYANESIAHIYRTWGTRTNFANKSRSEKTANTHIDTRQKVDWHREMSTSING